MVLCCKASPLYPVKSYKSTSLTAGSDCKQAEGVLQGARAIKCYWLDFKKHRELLVLLKFMLITLTYTPQLLIREVGLVFLFAAERSAQLPLCSALLHLMAGPHSWVWSILKQQNFYPLRSEWYNLLPIVRKQKRNNNSGSCRLYLNYKTLFPSWDGACYLSSIPSHGPVTPAIQFPATAGDRMQEAC